MGRMDKLKPCPFCGNVEPLVVVDDETEELFGVCCFKCESAIKAVFEERAEAVEAWNRRVMAELDRLTCRDPEGRARLMPDVDLMAVIERLCQIEERGKGVLIMPRAEQQIAVSAGLRRKWKERRSENASQ